MRRAVRAVLLTLMLMVMGLPLVYTMVVRKEPLGWTWLASPRLGKVVFPIEPEWTLGGWMSGEFQPSAEAWFANAVEPRGWVIPLTNQLLYAVFRKSYMYHRTIVIGRRGELYESSYVAAYCEDGEVGDAEALAASAARVGALRAHLSGGGKAMIVLITPSKAAVVPERLPAAVCSRPVDASGRRRRLVSELRSAGVAVIDGHALVMTMKAEDPLPPFPRGGTHWSRLVGARVAGVVMREAGRQLATELGGVEVDDVRWDGRPEKSDRDLASLLSLFVPPFDYRVGTGSVVCRPTTEGAARNLLTVGGSFLYQVLDAITDCRLFRRVENYFYYDTLYERWPGHHRERPDLTQLRWRDKLAETDVVILEVAEHLIGRAPHFERFTHDALAVLRSDARAASSPTP